MYHNGTFAKKLGFKQTSFSEIETGKANISERLILLLCSVYNVNETWLRTGERRNV